MKSTSVSFFLLVSVLAAALAFTPSKPHSASAAGLAEDHTVLYYLIEMQRRAKRTCDGVSMPEPPSLMPSASLRSLAREAAASGKAVQPPADSPVFIASIFGGTPQEAADNLAANQCRELMSPALHYIGAYNQQGNWTVIMSALDPKDWPAGPGPEQGPGAEPGTGQTPPPGLIPSNLNAPPQTSAPSPEAHPAQANVPGDPQDGLSRGGEPIAPASPVVVGEVAVDNRGKPVGPLLPPSLAGAGGENQVLASASQSFYDGRPAPGLTGAIAGRTEAAQPSRPGVTPLYDERTMPPGTGAFADAAPVEPALKGQPGMPPRPGQGWQTPVTTQQPAAQGSLMAPVPTQQPSPVPRQGQSTMPVQTFRPDPANKSDPAAALALVNDLRAKGASCLGTPMPPVPPLGPHPALSAAARTHAADMAARRYFSSTTPEGVTLGRRLSNVGYDWGFVAENIARGSDSAERAVQSWLGDANQCRNIMGAQYSQAGVAYDPVARIWVFTMAAPAESGAIRMR